MRSSATLHTHLLYVAVPVGSGGVVSGAVRITYPMTSRRHADPPLLAAARAIASVVLAAAALVGVRLARFVTRPLRGLEDAAAAVGEGELDARAPELEGPPEVRSLSRVFNETVVKLEQLLRSQEEFVADASHELRTPLTALRLRLESLERRLDDEGRQRSRRRRSHEVERLAEPVETLLALARADAGAAPASAVDVGGARAGAGRGLACARRGARRRARRRDERGPDRARRAADGSGRCSTTCSRTRSRSLRARRRSRCPRAPPARGPSCTSRDEGPGLTAEQRARAFDRFWRAGSGDGGSGLGLAIVKRLVEADEGEVELRRGRRRRHRRRRAPAPRLSLYRILAIRSPARFRAAA